jgi:hypothetical protein
LEAGIALLWQNQAGRIHVRKRGNPDWVSASERDRRMIMAVNHKLTNVVKDRVVQNFQLNASELLISFVDGSTMTVTIAECISPPLHEGATIRQIAAVGNAPRDALRARSRAIALCPGFSFVTSDCLRRTRYFGSWSGLDFCRIDSFEIAPSMSFHSLTNTLILMICRKSARAGEENSPPG